MIDLHPKEGNKSTSNYIVLSIIKEEEDHQLMTEEGEVIVEAD